MLKITNLTVQFGSIVALNDITATVGPGRITAVIGANASGKSTLLRCMAGLLKPTDGEVSLNDRRVYHMPPRALAQRLAYVAQRPSIAAAFKVEEVVSLGRYALPSKAGAIDDAMRRLDLSALADRVVPTLSVGQQQRVAIARAFAQHQDQGIVVLDEPTSALDMKHALLCAAQLRELADNGATVIMSVHDLTMAASIADEVMLLHEGSLLGHGRVEQVMTRETLQTVFGVSFEAARRTDGTSVLLPTLLSR